MTGNQLKSAIKLAGITIDEAATLMEMSRQTLYIHMKKADIDPDLVETAKKVLLPKLRKRYPDKDLEPLFTTPPTVENLEVKQLKEVVEAQAKTINLQDKLIRELESQLEDYRSGKAGARRNSA